MPIRITGMNSGLDTESIISELVKAQKTKVDSVKKKQTSLEWKQDAWKDLNSKIYKLFNQTLANMRMATDYSKKTTEISNSEIAKIITGDSAMSAMQKLKVEKIATTGYLTGAAISGDATGGSKLTDLGITAGSSFSVTTGGKTTDIKITESTTINELVGKLKDAGVEASFDEKYKRFHIASKETGKLNDFSITANNVNGSDALGKLGILEYSAEAMEEYRKYANMTGTEKDAVILAETNRRRDQYISRRTQLQKTLAKQTETNDANKLAFDTEYGAGALDAAKADPSFKTTTQDRIGELEALGDSATDADKEELSKLRGKLSLYESCEKSQEAVDATAGSIASVENYVDFSADPPAAKDLLIDEVTAALEEKITTAQNIVADYDAGRLTGSAVNRTQGSDAVIWLNGVKYEGESNTFEINGLTITALKESTEEVTLSTRQDTEGIYGMIKNFITEYGTLINEMDKLYGAKAAKGYEPLTDEERDEMSDSEVEKWEDKIKDSILRGDSNLSTVASAMKDVMLRGVEVNGEKMYLSSFGVETLGYFGAGENEKNAYHINGDKDDAAVSSKENDLMTAIASDPDTVISFFSQLSQNLYTELNNQSSSIEGVRSFGSFYDDKRMQEDYNDYTSKIKKQEEKLTAMEEKWYNKFSAMETALARLQSNQSAVSGLLGGMQ